MTACLTKGFAVTTGRMHGSERQAQAWARELGVSYIARERASLPELLSRHGLAALLVAGVREPRVFTMEGGFLAYHPSMAILRWQQLQRCGGDADHFAAAAGLRRGMRVLDCTLGLAADAAVASCLVGSEGCVVGLEAAPLLHFLVRQGLKNYICEDAELTAALRRITALRAEAGEYLRQCLEQGAAYDVIYFDPMFRRPVQGSSGMDALRPLAWEQPLTRATVDLARQLAPRVVIKERFAGLLRELGCTEIRGGRYARVKYGIITS